MLWLCRVSYPGTLSHQTWPASEYPENRDSTTEPRARAPQVIPVKTLARARTFQTRSLPRQLRIARPQSATAAAGTPRFSMGSKTWLSSYQVSESRPWGSNIKSQRKYATKQRHRTKEPARGSQNGFSKAAAPRPLPKDPSTATTPAQKMTFQMFAAYSPADSARSSTVRRTIAEALTIAANLYAKC